MAVTDKGRISRVFKIAHPSRIGNAQDHEYSVVILPEPTQWERVRDAWTHAVRYSAKGIDLTDYDAALVLLKQRHPSWEIIDSSVLDVMWDTKRAGEDVAEA
jgi:hypothetical protein